ncbi:MAG TPA: glycosyl hydrolase [Syntrophomonadaceae bacterium]|nr:glycosyl hydrolase [Syntrophomonadaceae bacterium]
MIRKFAVCATMLLSLLVCLPGSAAADTYLKNGQITTTAEFDPSDDFKTITPLSSGNNRLYDYANGYALDYPGDMWVDPSLSAVRVVLANSQTQVEIYHDDFNNTINTANDYIVYSNKFVNNSAYTLEMNKTIRINGLQAHLLQWERAPLSSVSNDRCHYLSAELVKNNREVYTIFIKSSDDPSQYLPLVKSFRIIESQGTPQINTRFVRTDRVSRLNTETRDFYQHYFSNSAGLTWGIYSWSVGDNLDALNSLEKRLGSPFSVLVWYKSLGTPLPLDLLNRAYSQGKYLELTFHTQVTGADNRNTLYDILNGQYDQYFNQYARDLKSFGHPVLFRLDNEMNGDWCFWCSWNTCKDSEVYTAAWRHIHQIFEANQVDNVLWVWNPNDLSFPGFQWNHYLTYFPGTQYVDIVGMTGYNTGTHFAGEYWRSFDSIYQPLYNDYMKMFDYPFMITEFACSSVGGDKVQWINDMFASIKNYPNIKVANWFSGVDLDAQGQPGRIYRLDENDQCIAAFSRGMKQP